MFLKEYGFSQTEVDNMTPFDKDIFLIFIEQKIKKQEQIAHGYQ